MKARTFLLAVLAPLALGSRWAGDSPSYQPRAGASLSKQIAQEFVLDLDDMTMKLDGKDVSAMAKQVEVAMKTTRKLAVTDHYEAVEGGRPHKLRRSFDEISGNSHVSTSAAEVEMPEPEKDVAMSSELEGTTVVFTWNEGQSSYDKAFDDDSQGDEELLKGLDEDIDLRGMLPTSEVSEGDTWKLPAEIVKAALHPGGNVKLMPEGASEMMGGVDQMSPDEMLGELEGDFTATYGGTREEDDGTRVAVIRLKLDGKSAQDMTSQFETVRKKMPMPQGLEVEVTAFDSEVEQESEGELLWNLDTGLVHALTLSGEVRLVVDQSMNMVKGDLNQTIDLSLSFTGTHTLTLTTGK